MAHTHTKQAGVTLVELVTWMALSSLLMVSLGGIFSSASKSWVYGHQQYDVQQAARLVINTMSNELRYGDSVNGLVPDPTVNVANPSVLFTSHKDGLRKTYYLNTSNNQLYYIEGAKQPVAMTGQNNSGIYFLPPKEGSPFDIQSNSVNINLRVVAMNNPKLPIKEVDITNEIATTKTFSIQTTVTLLDSFLK